MCSIVWCPLSRPYSADHVGGIPPWRETREAPTGTIRNALGTLAYRFDPGNRDARRQPTLVVRRAYCRRTFDNEEESMKRATQALLSASDWVMRKNIATAFKQITIREGHRDYTPGLMALYCPDEPWTVHAEITSVRHCLLSEVTKGERRADGFTSCASLLVSMRRFYLNLTLNSPVTVIRWHNVSGVYATIPARHDEHLRGLRAQRQFKPGERVRLFETDEIYIVEEQFIDGWVSCTNEADGCPSELQPDGLELLPPQPQKKRS